MLKRFATKKEICDCFAEFDVGENVTILSDTIVDEGVIEKGSAAVITDIILNPLVSCPDIPIDKLDLSNYDIGLDKKIFLYRIAVNGCSITTPFDSTELTHGEVPIASIDVICEAKKQAHRKQIFNRFKKGIVVFLIMEIIVFCLGLLLNVVLSPDFKSLISLKVVGFSIPFVLTPYMIHDCFPLGYIKEKENKH